MKKILALLALVLGVVSCQTEPEGLDVNVGGAQDVTVCVSLPEATRANSAEGAFENVDWNTYTIRYIFQVFYGENQATESDATRQVIYSNEKNVSFPVRLVPNRDYNFVAWADIVPAEGKTKDEIVAYSANDDYHYNTTDLKAIELKGEWNAMDETRDAYTGFYNTADTDKHYSGASQINVNLTRPFAKLRVVTTDVQSLRHLGITPKQVNVTYTVPVYNSFNALSGAVNNTTNEEQAFSFNLSGEEAKNYEDIATTDNLTLFADYLFGAENNVIKFSLKVADQNGTPINKELFSFNTDIPVKRNHLTTIKGNILTEANNVEVEVVENGAFANENIYIEGDLTLTEDLVVDRPLVVRADATAVIDLNGYDIINTTESEVFGEGEGIIAYGKLTIKGNGTVKGSTMAVWARGNAVAVVNIYGGTFEGCAEGFAKGGRSVVYASSDNTINIYGGTFKALAADKTSYANKTEGVYAALNVADNHGMINVYGGSFYKQNPAAPGTEPKAWNDTHPNGFLAEDCVVETDGDFFNVIYDPYYYWTKVSTFDELKEAIKTANNKIVLLNDITGDVTISKSVTIDGNGKTYTGAMKLEEKNTHVTLKNVNFDGKGYNGYAITTRGAYYLTIEDCTAKNYGYGFVQLASSTVLTTVKNVTVSNMNYGVKVDYSTAVEIENANINVGVAAVLNSNYGEKTITIKNSNLNILGTWTRNNTTKTNYVFEGDNSIDTFVINTAIDNFKLAGGATLTAPNEITVTTDDGYTVVYADGKYAAN